MARRSGRSVLQPSTFNIQLAKRPDLAVEAEHWRAGRARVAGGDGVGLGCLCGPVVAAAVMLPPGCAMIEGVRDSKTLSAAQRQRLIDRIRDQAVAIGVGAASVAEIERLNVRNAEILALRRALARLGRYDHVLIDGKPHRNIDFGPYTAIVDGDASSYTIACASIVAKVVRDRLMERLAARYPVYGWARNVGYSTRQHLDAIAAHGLTPFHRRSYAPVRARLEQSPDLAEEAGYVA
ncbi:MAG TPA: ribonuclease HII [Chloroflexota bacterium]